MTENNEAVLADLNQIFRTVLNNDGISLTRQTTAADVPEWDSLNHVELVLAIEKHFNIRFKFDELQKFKNLSEMCDNISSKLVQHT